MVPQNLERYKSGEFSDWITSEFESELLEIEISGIEEINFAKLNERAGDNHVNDDLDVRLLFTSLSTLNPELARDPRLWTTLCHLYALPYIRFRNPKIFTDEGPDLLQLILSRFFVVGGHRGFERTNSLARLWWFGHIARRTGLDFNEAVYALTENTGHRADMIERPTVAVCSNYMSAMVGVLVEAKKNKDDFFDSRDAYRAMLMAVFELAGRKFFPAVEIDAIKDDIKFQISKNR